MICDIKALGSSIFGLCFQTPCCQPNNFVKQKRPIFQHQPIFWHQSPNIHFISIGLIQEPKHGFFWTESPLFELSPKYPLCHLLNIPCYLSPNSDTPTPIFLLTCVTQRPHGPRLYGTCTYVVHHFYIFITPLAPAVRQLTLLSVQAAHLQCIRTVPSYNAGHDMHSTNTYNLCYPYA